MPIDLTYDERKIAAAIGFDEAVLAAVKEETDGILCAYGAGRYGYPFNVSQGAFQSLLVVLPDANDIAGIVDALNRRLEALQYQSFSWIGQDGKPYVGVLPTIDASTCESRKGEMMREEHTLIKVQYGHTGPRDWDMYLAFDTLTPDIAKLPHCVLHAERQNYQIILDVTGEKAGWFRRGPSIWADGMEEIKAELEARYPTFDELDDYLDTWPAFKIWEHPVLQADVLKDGHAAGFEGNSAFVSTDIDEAAFNGANTNENTYEWVTKWIHGLRWAWFSLWWESDEILFVAAPEHAHRVDAVIRRVRSEGRSVKRMKWGRRRYYLLQA